MGKYSQEQCIQNSAHEKHGQTNTPPVTEQVEKINDSLIFRTTTRKNWSVRNPKELVHNFTVVPRMHKSKARVYYFKTNKQTNKNIQNKTKHKTKHGYKMVKYLNSSSFCVNGCILMLAITLYVSFQLT